MEYRSRHSRSDAYDASIRPILLRVDRLRLRIQSHPCHPPLAKLEVCADHPPERATRSTSTTRSTGTSRHVLLKAAFPLAASGPFATYEIPYGTIDRPTTRNNSWEKAQFEVPAMRWADLSGPGADGKVHGLSILNQTKYGYDAVGNTLRLTLLRSPKWPDAEADMGHHHFHYALYPHAGTWKEALTVRHGYEYNYPLTAVVTTAHPGSLPAIALLRLGLAGECRPDRREKGRRRERPDLPRLRVGGQRDDGRVPCAAGSNLGDRDQSDGDAGRRAAGRDRRCGEGADSSLRDSDHPRGLP